MDGIIFVAGSQQERAEASIEAMHNLYENIEAYGYDVEKTPFAKKFNKRYMPNPSLLKRSAPRPIPLGSLVSRGWPSRARAFSRRSNP